MSVLSVRFQQREEKLEKCTSTTIGFLIFDAEPQPGRRGLL